MSATVIELNDMGIRASNQTQCLHESPGFALVQADGVTVGEFARNQARLNPLNTHYQYWQNLNTEPLQTDNPQVRHYGDLVYLQLQEMTRHLKGKPDIVLAVPGSFSREQLALLLGICQALELNVIAMVDSAVAAASGHSITGNHLLLDLQLNQALVTELYIGEKIEHRKTHVIAKQGWQSLIDNLAKLITGEFIRQVRFDPKHTASSEQSLYNQLPQWLRQAQTQKDIQLEVENQRIQMPQAQLLEHVSDFFAPLLSRTQQLHRQGDILYSDRWQLLQPIAQTLPNARALSNNSLPQNCITHLAQLQAQSRDNITFTTALAVETRTQTQPSTDNTKNSLAPSHLLWGDHAYSLADLCFLRDSQTSPIAKQANGSSIARIKRGQLSLEGDFTVLVNQQPIKTPTNLSVGDELKLPNIAQPFKCISIREPM